MARFVTTEHSKSQQSLSDNPEAGDRDDSLNDDFGGNNHQQEDPGGTEDDDYVMVDSFRFLHPKVGVFSGNWKKSPRKKSPRKNPFECR